MKQKIQPGAEFDFTTPGELAEHLNIITRQTAQERARGVQPWRADGTAAVSGTDVQIPAIGSNETLGIDPGWAVYVYAARVFGLGTNDVITIYRGTGNVVEGQKFVGQMTAAVPQISFGSKGLLLKGGEQLTFSGTGLAATGDIVVNAEGTQVPETDLYKLIT